MDTPERRVLRRKRQVLCSRFKLSDEYIQTLLQRGLINVSARELISNETTNSGRVTKFLEVQTTTFTNFEEFCKVLDTEYEWLADELRAELKTEKGELVIEDYIDKEAALLVQKEFGNSKRLSQAEKKDLQALIALRTQYAKEVWKKRLANMKQVLKDEEGRCEKREKLMNQIIATTCKYVRINRQRLVTAPLPECDQEAAAQLQPEPAQTEQTEQTEHTERSEATEQTDKTEEEQQSAESATTNGTSEDKTEENPVSAKPGPTEEFLKPLKRLERYVNELLDMTSQSLLERDRIIDERTRALTILEIQDKNSKLDKTLEVVFARMSKELKEAQDQCKAKEEVAKDLDAQVNELKKKMEEEIETKDQKIESLAAHLKKTTKHVQNLQDEIGTLNEEIRSVKGEVSKYKQRSEVLEKHRRLGYKTSKEGQSPVQENTPKFPSINLSPGAPPAPKVQKPVKAKPAVNGTSTNAA